MLIPVKSKPLSGNRKNSYKKKAAKQYTQQNDFVAGQIDITGNDAVGTK